MSRLRTCNACGWVHFGVTRAYAEDEVQRFNDYVRTIDPKKWQEYWGGRLSSVADYERCGSCGSSHVNFRDAVEGDCPDGCTIGPIIVEEP